LISVCIYGVDFSLLSITTYVIQKPFSVVLVFSPPFLI